MSIDDESDKHRMAELLAVTIEQQQVRAAEKAKDDREKLVEFVSTFNALALPNFQTAGIRPPFDDAVVTFLSSLQSIAAELD